MRSSRRATLAALLLLGVVGTAPRGSGACETGGTLPPGVEHRRIVRSEASAGERVEVHVLAVDPSRARLAVARAMDELVGSETTSSLASRLGAVAAVNGGFFRTEGAYRGEPVGVFCVGGKLLSEPARGRPALAVGSVDGVTRTAFVHVQMEAALLFGAGLQPVAGFNRPRGPDELVVFTPELHATTLTAPDGLEVVVERGRVASVKDRSGSSGIPREGFVAAAAGTARERLLRHAAPGVRAEVRVSTRLLPSLDFEPEVLVGGGPILLRGSQAAAPAPGEWYAESFLANRHPRTAIGLREDGVLLLVTVDGRQPGKSAGMTIEELRLLMRELGCAEALNLDGGGSTTMVVWGQVLNSPSDATGERPVGDALLVFPR